MTIETLAADIASRSKAFAQDSTLNVAEVIKTLVLEFIRSRMSCAYCHAEIEVKNPKDIADHVLSCRKNPIVNALLEMQPALDAMDDVCLAYEEARSGTREPVSIYLQKPEAQEKLTSLVVALNSLVKLREDFRAKTKNEAETA